jgi:hypothetical protein
MLSVDYADVDTTGIPPSATDEAISSACGITITITITGNIFARQVVFKGVCILEEDLSYTQDKVAKWCQGRK